MFRRQILLDIVNRSLHAGCKAIYPILFKGSLQDGISKVDSGGLFDSHFVVVGVIFR